MEARAIETADAPAAIGPYSQAVVAGGLVFCSGQIALEPRTGDIVAGGIAEQTDRVLKNLARVLDAAGSSIERVVKTTVYLSDLRDFAAMNGVYAHFFAGTKPARATVEVARLPKDVLVEIDCIATVA